MQVFSMVYFCFFHWLDWAFSLVNVTLGQFFLLFFICLEKMETNGCSLFHSEFCTALRKHFWRLFIMKTIWRWIIFGILYFTWLPNFNFGMMSNLTCDYYMRAVNCKNASSLVLRGPGPAWEPLFPSAAGCRAALRHIVCVRDFGKCSAGQIPIGILSETDAPLH